MKKLVVFTGAGVSADSGLATFRDSDGTWGNYRIEEVCIPEALDFNRRGVIRFYNERRAEMLKAEPNAAHRRLPVWNAISTSGSSPRMSTICTKGRVRRIFFTCTGSLPNFVRRTIRRSSCRSTASSRVSTTALPTVRCCVRTSSSSASRFPNSTVRRNLPPGPTS